MRGKTEKNSRGTRRKRKKNVEKSDPRDKRERVKCFPASLQQRAFNQEMKPGKRKRKEGDYPDEEKKRKY